MKARKHHRDHRVDPPQKVLLWNAVLEPELVKERPLISHLPSHHRHSAGF